MMKKYLGQLLNTQKLQFEFPIINEDNFKVENIYNYLMNEIKSGHILELDQMDNVFVFKGLKTDDQNIDKSMFENSIFFLKIHHYTDKKCTIEIMYYQKNLERDTKALIKA